ncbi:MAG TPA: RDD family protein [Verrucomicrobiae bacterium]|nr:RDD family protein [Verrucomicrobiae bacterium]
MSAPRTNTLLIRTPEGILFSQLLAGPMSRFLAWLIDLACIMTASSILGSITGVLGIISIDFARALTVLLYFAISIGYGIAAEWGWRGQTIGKRLLRLRVVDAHGLKIQFSQIVIRNLLRFIDALPAFYLVGGIATLCTRKCQRLGDFAANTVVVRNPRLGEPDLDQILAGKYNSLRQYAHLEARLRQRVTPAEAAIAMQAILRREELDPVSRVELFHDLAEHFRAKVEFPQDATGGISDEQYVRNVLDIVYRTRTGAAKMKAPSYAAA